MPIFSIDNDRSAIGGQDLVLDQTAGAQTPLTTDTGDDMNPAISLDGSNDLTGLGSDFATFLAGLSLSTDQKDFAVNTDGAASNADFIQVTPEGGETINDLKFVVDSNTAVSGLTTLGGDPLFLHVDASGNYATLTTSAADGGRIVAAFALTDESIDATTGVATAGVQMVTFEALNHSDGGDPDDSVPLTDALKVAADTAVSFNFDQLDAGNFLWAAVGDGDSAMLITGQDLNVKDSGKPSAIGNIEKGGTDPSDAVNTSKATDTTIGINAQHFAPTNTGDGATGVFTFVTGYDQLQLSTPQYTGQNVKQIAYDDYINTSSASVFISQLTGGSSAKIHFSFFEAGGGGTDKAPGDLLPEQGYSDVSGQSYSYIGNQDTDSHLTDDTDVLIATVTIGGATWNYNDSTNGTSQGGITVTITGNDVIVDGAQANDLIAFTAVDGASSVDGTFNRIDIQAMSGSASFDIGSINLDSGGVTAVDLGGHLSIHDDGPTITPQAVPDDNNLVVDNTIGGDSASSSYGFDTGTDGGSVAITGAPDSDGFSWQAFDVDGDLSTGDNEIKGFLDGNELYTLIVNEDGTYTFTLTGELPGGTLDLNPAEVIKAGAPDAPILLVGAVQNDDYVQMSALSTVGNGNINESHGFVGVDNGNLDMHESLTFKLFDGDDDQLTFEGIQIGTKSAQGGQYSWTAELVGGGTISSSSNELVGKNGTIIIDSADLGGATIDSITITKVSGPATKIGLGDIHIITQPPDVVLGFDVQLIDGDSDTASASFNVSIDGDGNGTIDSSAGVFSVINTSPVLTASTTSMIDPLHHEMHSVDHLMLV